MTDPGQKGRSDTYFTNEIEVAFSELIHSPWGNSETQTFHPSVDLYETRNSYNLTADLPGFDPQSISLFVKHNRLMLCGERIASMTCDTCRYHLAERRNGRFCRALPVDQPIDIESVSTSYENGIYKAVIPKKLKGADNG